MNDDLVNRLRLMGDRASHRPNMYHTAADRIEALTARAEAAEARAKATEVERLREALQTIVDSYEATCELHTSHADCAANLYDHARFALRGEQK